MMTFKETGLREEILTAVEALGFETPTPIQAKTIPHLLSSNQDIIALAQTGTGKTAAFGLPAIHLADEKNKQTQVLVLCPTRELCLQITRDLDTYSKFIKGLNVVAVYGGTSIDTQIRALKKGAQIVVGTPGRTKDLINRKRLLLGNVEKVILDEADEMLTMGFKDDLEAILAATPNEKQVLLFSATMSRAIISVTNKYMDDPIQIKVARMNEGAKNVTHIYHMVHARDRYEVLKRIADMNPDIYGIVFCRTRRETKEVANKLIHDGYSADVLNGDLSQSQRDDVMNSFRKKQIQIMVATDVAARGLDVNDLTHVINYNLPDDSEVYIHRSGRTGRAGKTGVSIAIIHTREVGRIREIERKAGVTFTKKLVPSGKDICRKQLYTLIDKVKEIHVDSHQIEPFLPEIYEKLESLSREELIQHFVSVEFNRFLKYYKNARDINVSERGRDRRSREDRRRTPFSRLFINVGSTSRLTPARLIGVINEALDSGNAAIGKIEILKNFSFFEIDQQMESTVINALNGVTFEGITLSVEVSQPKGSNRGGGRSSSYRKKSYSGGGRRRENARKNDNGGNRRR
ncbi:MAG TPA: DEAD/DEAH box helicase, partial [Phaeodactylibacter sp.]|nr:DEAD/DEAH box helicase [Phaeodactylibacter sp.]